MRLCKTSSLKGSKAKQDCGAGHSPDGGGRGGGGVPGLGGEVEEKWKGEEGGKTGVAVELELEEGWRPKGNKEDKKCE